MIKVTPLVSPKIISDTINRMGVASESNKMLYTTGVLIKDPSEQWYVAHFKELLYAIDSNRETVLDEDNARLGMIVNLLVQFNLVQAEFQDISPINLKVLKKTDISDNGGDWHVVKKFTPSQSKMEKIFNSIAA